MKIGILTSTPGEWHVRKLVEVFNRYNLTPYLFSIKKFMAKIGLKPKVASEGNVLEDMDAVIVREAPIASLEHLIFRMDVLHRLEDLGVKVINSPSCIEKTCDKYYTSYLFEDLGLPTPKTVVTEDFWEAMDAFKELGEDVVVKPLFGAQGKGTFRVDNRDVAHRYFRFLQLSRNTFYLQEFIPHNKEDIRVFIVGDKVVSAMKRKGETWKTNISQGAVAEKIKPAKELKEKSLKITQFLGCEYAGVDILKSEDGKYYFIEVNSIPAWRGLQTVTEKNIAEEILKHVIKLVKK